MLKKLVVGTLTVGLIGILIWGAINRTQSRTSLAAEGVGRGAGGRGQELVESDGSGQGYRGGRANEASGIGLGADGERGYPNYETLPENWETHSGVVTQLPGDGEELIIETEGGETLTIGTGPLDLAAQGLALQSGEAVQVRGYWEDDEFKAAQITRLSDGQSIALRDEGGRPAWAGGGRNAQNLAQSNLQGGQGRGGSGAGGSEVTSGDQTGAGQAQVQAWIQLQGSVVSVDADALLVQTAQGEQVTIEGRPWSFIQEQGFMAQVGDQVTMTGFYEGETFEVGLLVNETSGQTAQVRDESGRPGWAGRGRRGG